MNGNIREQYDGQVGQAERASQPEMVDMHIRATREQYEAIRERAFNQRRSVSALIREAMAATLAKK